MHETYLPIVLLLIISVGFTAMTLVASHFIGSKRTNSAYKEASFECGVESVGNARTPFKVQYFLIAILFVLFDVEIIFLYPWAVNFRELGWKGFAEMLSFTAVVAVGFVYILKHGLLDFEKH